MFNKYLCGLLLFLVTQAVFAESDKLSAGLNRIEAILSVENNKVPSPGIVWRSLEKFEEKLYYTFAHDPSGLPVHDVPVALRSPELTKDLIHEWTKLEREARGYGIDGSVREWAALDALFQGIIELRNNSLFIQSRKSLKSGALTKSIEDLSRYWTKRWYLENPQITFIYDAQQISQLKKLVTELRSEVKATVRTPASQSETPVLPYGPMAAVVAAASGIFFVLGQFLESRKSRAAQMKASRETEFLKNFNYQAWVKELSDGIDALMNERDKRLQRTESCQELSHSMRELRVSFMLARSESELRDLAQKLSVMSMELENLLQGIASHPENEAFEQVMKTVIQLCVNFEKKQTTELKIAA